MDPSLDAGSGDILIPYGDIGQFSGRIPALVDLKDIHEKPGPYAMSYGFDLGPLIRSIRSYGMINTPFVRKNKEGGFHVVIGYRRIMAMKKLTQDRISCVDLSGSGLSDLEMLLFNLHDNLSFRSFNLVEKGMIIHRLCHYHTKEEIRKQYSGLLNITNKKHLEILAKVETLPDFVKKAVACGAISLNALGQILEMDKRSSDSIVKAILKLNLNMNQQIQLIEYMIDLSLKEGKPIHQILSEDWSIVLLEAGEPNIPQRAKKMFEFLKSRRFPWLTLCENNFNKRIAGLKLPAGVRVTHPPFFESSGYRLDIPFQNGHDLKKKIHDIEHNTDIENIGDPWDQNQ